ncbi:MAG: hypothetical protein KDD76_06385, partial [Rickettsiales bacterium]|nr:hypothetical protein [Rickettsiales bacterium]
MIMFGGKPSHIDRTCCKDTNPYGQGRYNDAPEDKDEYLFDRDYLTNDPENNGNATPRQHVQFNEKTNNYGQYWCEFEVPYRPHGDNVPMLSGAGGPGIPPTLNMVNYDIQWKMPDMDPADFGTKLSTLFSGVGLSVPASVSGILNDIGNAVSSWGVELGRIKTDEGPISVAGVDVAVRTTTLSTQFKMVERIRDGCQAFSARLPWDKESAHKSQLARFFGYENLCNKWRGMYDRVHDSIDVMQYRLERYNYEFLRSFLDCTGPFIEDAPWACEKTDFQCMGGQWDKCPKAADIPGNVGNVNKYPEKWWADDEKVEVQKVCGYWGLSQLIKCGVSILAAIGGAKTPTEAAVACASPQTELFTGSWCDCWKCDHNRRKHTIVNIEEPELERRQRMGHLGTGVPFCECTVRLPLINLCVEYRCPNYMRMIPRISDEIQGDLIYDGDNAINCCRPKFEAVKPVKLPDKRFWCNCHDDVPQTFKCNENWCTCQQSMGSGALSGVQPEMNMCDKVEQVDPNNDGKFNQDYYYTPVTVGVFAGGFVANYLPFVPNLGNIPIGPLRIPAGVMYAQYFDPGCPWTFPRGVWPLSDQIRDMAQNYIGYPSQCNPTQQYDRWLGCFHQARADANVVLEREVSTGITPSTAIYEADFGPFKEGTNLRWTSFEPNILARLPIKPQPTLATPEFGEKGDPATELDELGNAHKSSELTFFSQTRSDQAPYMEATIPHVISEHRRETAAPTTMTYAEELEAYGNEAVASTIAGEYGRKFKAKDAPNNPGDGPSLRATDGIVGARGCDIGGWYELLLYQARCIKLFRLNCMCDYNKTFIEGSAESYVLRRSGREFNTVRLNPTTQQVEFIPLLWPLMWRGYAGPEYARYYGHPESKLWMRARGSADWEDAGGNSLSNETHSGDAVARYDYKGLDCAEKGDFVIWDEQLRNEDGSDAGSRRHIAFVEATSFRHTDSDNPCDIKLDKLSMAVPTLLDECGEDVNAVDPNSDLAGSLARSVGCFYAMSASIPPSPWVIVSEWNWGKNLDACGNSNRWKAMTIRQIFKEPVAASLASKNTIAQAAMETLGNATGIPGVFDDPDAGNEAGLCNDADNAICWEPNWERLKVYRPMLDYWGDSPIYTAITAGGLMPKAAGSGIDSIYIRNQELVDATTPDPSVQPGAQRTLIDPERFVINTLDPSIRLPNP